MGLWKKTRTKGTGSAGYRSSRWAPRAEVKTAARKHRRAEDSRARANGIGVPIKEEER